MFKFQLCPSHFQVAQGDVLITRAIAHNTTDYVADAAVPALSTTSEPLVLMEGEKEGHRHVMVSEDPIDILLDEVEEGAGTRRMVARVGSRGATVTHDEHAAVAIPPNTVVEIRGGQTEYDPTQKGYRTID